jgi:hypothetical protein
MTTEHVDAIKREALALVDLVDRDPLVGAVIRGDASCEEYARFLRATYHYVRWSGPLLAATAVGLSRRGCYPWLTALAETKSREEAPHDRWALHDLRACGANAELVKASAVPLAVTAYVDWGFALAAEGSPAFLGAAYALEFISMSRAQAAADNLRARAAIPEIEHAVAFLTGHGAADIEHVALLEEALGRIDDPVDVAELRLSAAVLRTLYPRFFGGARSAAGGPAAGSAWGS